MPFAQSILFPVDFSPGSVLITPAVAAMASRLNAPVTLLHAADALRPEFEVADVSLLAQIERHATAKLAAFGSDGLAGLTVKRVVAPGPAARAIVDCAAAMAEPMVMMPTRGESAFRRLLLGSVTASVLHDAGCPVWTTAHREDGGPIPTAYRSVVCAIDLGRHTVDVLRLAARFAADFGARVQLVHSVPGIDPRFESGPAQRAHAFLVDDARGTYPTFEQDAGVDFGPLEVVEDVSLTEGIAAAVDRHHADLLIIGRGVMQGVLGRLRTNAHDLIRLSRCPVLSV